MKLFFKRLASSKLDWFIITLMLLLLTTIFAPSINLILRFDRGYIYQGEIWRLITGHFVHFTANHALMNLTGLILIKTLFTTTTDNKLFPFALLFIALTTSLALLSYSMELYWYQGFSGILHGLLAFFLIVHLKLRASVDWLIMLALITKLIIEQLPGYNVYYLMDYIDAPIAVDAHFYGALAGLLWGGLVRGGKIFKTRRKNHT